jgi:hypothetical protein
MLRTLLSILLGHLLADFVFQSNRLVERKRRGSVLAYCIHGLIHYFAVIVTLGFLVPGSILSVRAHLAVLGLTLVHLLIDLAKIRLAAKHVIHDGAWSYSLDQLFHLIAITVAACVLSPSGSLAAIQSLLSNVRNASASLIAVPIVYIVVIFGGGYFIRFVTKRLAENAGDRSSATSSAQLQNAGLYIGWLERFLVITALLLQSPAMIGLIFTAKSIARYPELKTERFAEYFLIGTLLSLSIAMVGGAILVRLLLHKFSISG